MNKLIILVCFTIALSISSKAQTFLAIGVDETQLALANNSNKLVLNQDKLTQPCMRMVFGYEDVWAIKLQLEGNPKTFALFGVGVGYRPLNSRT